MARHSMTSWMKFAASVLGLRNIRSVIQWTHGWGIRPMFDEAGEWTRAQTTHHLSKANFMIGQTGGREVCRRLVEFYVQWQLCKLHAWGLYEKLIMKTLSMLSTGENTLWNDDVLDKIEQLKHGSFDDWCKTSRGARPEWMTSWGFLV